MSASIQKQQTVEIFRDIYSLLSVQAARRGAAIALEAPGQMPVSYVELHARVRRTAAALLRAGVTRASRVAIVQPNGTGMATTMLGVSSVAIAVPLNPMYQRTEFLSYFSETKTSYLLVQQGIQSHARTAAEQQGIHVLELSGDGEIISPALAQTAGPGVRNAPENDGPLVKPNPEDVALILLTSGSTGRSKKVPLTHRNICVSVADICRSLELDGDDSCLCMWEQFHIGGLVDLLLAPLASGGRVVCASGFNAPGFFQLLSNHNPTWFQGVPATLNELLIYSEKKGIKIEGHSLRFIRSVAATLSPQLMERLEKHFGVPVIQTFGMTEAGPLITTNLLPPDKRKPGSVGKSCGPDIEIVDESGKPLATGGTGEVVVRGPNVISGYEDNPEANAHSFRDGWFHTGDTGYFDDEGYLYLSGRLKEMINRGGEKITPQEVDDVLLTHPSIAQAATFSIPHPTLGEEVGAAVVLRDGHSLTESAIREHVGSVLSEFKLPRKIIFLDELPRCPVGKISRRELSNIAALHRRSTSYVAPRNRLESFLTEVWSEELAVEGIGIDDDFADLGGDSLSSVRLVIGIETLLRVPLPEKALSGMQTVRQMAEYIEKNGGKNLRTAYAPDGVLGDDSGQTNVRQLLAAIASGRRYGSYQGDLGSDPRDILKRLCACRSRREMKALVKSLEGYMTPAEMLALVSDSWPPLYALTPRHMRVRFWKRRTAKSFAAFPGAMNWKRQRIAESVVLFTASEAPAQDKTLIVSFTGWGMRLGLPVSLFLSNVESDSCDILYLWDSYRNTYIHGLPGLGENMDGLSRWIGNFAAQAGYRNVISFGFSNGGLPAIYAALTNNWLRCIAIAPDSVTRYPHIEHFLHDHASVAAEHAATELRVIHGDANQHDITNADELAQVTSFTKVTIPTDRHNLLWYAYRRGILESLLRDCFEVPPGK